MNLRTVITENSIWKFDTILKRYLRFPRGEDMVAITMVPYSKDWDEYIRLERNGDRIRIHRPVEWGKGALRETGPISWDDLEPLDFSSEPW